MLVFILIFNEFTAFFTHYNYSNFFVVWIHFYCQANYLKMDPYIRIEWKQAKLTFWNCQCCWCEARTKLPNLMHIIFQPFELCDSFNPSGCQFVNFGILCLHVLMHIFHYGQYLNEYFEKLIIINLPYPCYLHLRPTWWH